MDRNGGLCFWLWCETGSLSARRAWIEILLVYLALIRYLSLSARRAWIEIINEVWANFSGLSLSARRAWIEICLPIELYHERGGRSPQGERG